MPREQLQLKGALGAGEPLGRGLFVLEWVGQGVKHFQQKAGSGPHWDAQLGKRRASSLRADGRAFQHQILTQHGTFRMHSAGWHCPGTEGEGRIRGAERGEAGGGTRVLRGELSLEHLVPGPVPAIVCWVPLPAGPAK